MTMKAKTSTVKESLTKKEKASIKKIAEKVKIDHKGAEKPQLLQKIKPDEMVILGSIPVVKWDIKIGKTDVDGNNIGEVQIQHVVKTLTVKEPAAKVKAIKEKCPDIAKYIRASNAKFIKKSGYYTSDLVAITEVKEHILKRIEKINLDFRYDREAHSLEWMRAKMFQFSCILNELRKFHDIFRFYANAVDEEFLVLPDLKKFTVKDRKFVPVEKPAAPKKPTSKK